MPPITLLQTASGEQYLAMLRATETLHRRFAERHGLDYRRFEGVLRGTWDWQATFNRIDLLGEMVAQGYDGWVVYVDADASVRDIAFPIRRYLAERSDYALIAAPGTAQFRSDINAGVFFLNLGHPLGREIVVRWGDFFREMVSDEMLAAAQAPWQALPNGHPFPDDQHLLQVLLMRDEALLDVLLVEEASFMNYAQGSFIGQVIREHGEDRVGALQRMVAATLAGETKPRTALHRVAEDFGHWRGVARIAVRYDALFGGMQHERFTVLDLGGMTPGARPAAHMWLEYFRHADVVAVAPEQVPPAWRARFFIRPDDPATLLDGRPPLRLVIDDHRVAAAERLARFDRLFAQVAPGGWYVIEEPDEQAPALAAWIATLRDGTAARATLDLIGAVHPIEGARGARATAIRRRDG